MPWSRRKLLSGAALAGGGGSLAALACALTKRTQAPGPWGTLERDPDGIFDLPPGFSYTIVERQGEALDDGLLVPGRFDGMACFEGVGGTLVLMRNSEQTPDDRRSSPYPSGTAAPGEAYDAGCLGGVTRTVLHPESLAPVHRHFALLGTERNCAGGPSPWGWLSCEESTEGPGGARKQRHGYVFACRHDSGRLVKAEPIRGYGRFRHEAVAVVEPQHVAYLTEDRDDGCLYRFVPNDPTRPFEGRLQALTLPDLGPGASTSNTGRAKIEPGQRLSIGWVDLDDVEAPRDDLRHRARDAGAAVFVRGEGIWSNGKEIWFCCTTGGAHLKGQVFKLVLDESGSATGLELVAEADGDLLHNPDNITFAPWGDVLICEDDYSPRGDRVRGVTPAGHIYEFGHNRLNGSEVAGGCFSPAGDVFFVNIYEPGITLAIRGPFEAARRR